MTLHEFLHEQINQQAAPIRQPHPVRDEWRAALEELMKQVKTWIEEADAEHVIQVTPTFVLRNEEGVGFYPAPGLTIDLGEQRVNLLPEARFVLGPLRLNTGEEMKQIAGRVDLLANIDCYHLWRLPRQTGYEWWITHDLEDTARPLDREAFESALVSLFQ